MQGQIAFDGKVRDCSKEGLGIRLVETTFQRRPVMKSIMAQFVKIPKSIANSNNFVNNTTIIKVDRKVKETAIPVAYYTIKTSRKICN